MTSSIKPESKTALPASLPSILFNRVPPIAVGQHGAMHKYPMGRSGGVNWFVPLPWDADDEMWNDTLCKLPAMLKFKISYEELRQEARSGNTQLRGYLN